MKIVKQLVILHKILFMLAVLFTFLSVILNLCWNRFLAQLLDILENTDSFYAGNGMGLFLAAGILIVLIHAISEYLSSYLSSCTCETFAHEMRMGYARYYLQSDIRTLSKLNVGEEQSAMQNELKDISDYLSENLFSLMKQFGTFAVTVVFLFCQNFKLAMLSIVPVIPLILYCSLSSKILKNYTQQCQNSRKKINGSADMMLELFPMIQIYDAYKMVQDTMKEQLSEWGEANIKKERIAARLMSLSGVLSFALLLALLGCGGFMVINGEISMGIFYIFINLSGNVSGFLQNMPNIYASFRRFSASVERLEEKLCINTQFI
ncbi:MAG: ABC transporter ATP-binding protein [Lachnospiraceae bacterium]|nr:ABC transporter ATP-binding protein [Lachnospiraceae bacterium]